LAGKRNLLKFIDFGVDGVDTSNLDKYPEK